MPVTQQLLDEFTKLIDDYSTQSKFKVLPSLRADRNLQENVALLTGLLKIAQSNNEKLNNQTIIYPLTTYVMDKTDSDPVFHACLKRFLKSYQAVTDSVYSAGDPIHLEPIPGADAIYIPALLLSTMRIENVTHESQKQAYERQLETTRQENTKLKSDNELLRKKENEFEQLKITFQELQKVNAQLHQAGIAFTGLDRILIPSQSNDAPSAVPMETTTIQTSNVPPPPPPPPLPMSLANSVLESSVEEPKQIVAKNPANTVRFRPDVTPIPGHGDLMAQLKSRLQTLGFKSEKRENQDEQQSASSLPQALSRPTPKPRKLIKKETENSIRTPMEETSQQAQAEIPVSRPISASFFQPVAITGSPAILPLSDGSPHFPNPLVESNAAFESSQPMSDRKSSSAIHGAPELKPKHEPNSLEKYQAAQKTDPAIIFTTSIEAMIKSRRPRIGSSENDSDNETWSDDESDNNTLAAQQTGSESKEWETISLN